MTTVRITRAFLVRVTSAQLGGVRRSLAALAHRRHTTPSLTCCQLRAGSGLELNRPQRAEAVALAGFASAVGRERGRHPVTSRPVLATGMRIEYLRMP